MGYLLKEALKTMCGVKRWDYAVFWKIGCHNPKLLIWEECYYEPPPGIIPQAWQFETNRVPSGGEWEGCLVPMPNRLHASEKVQLLVEKMRIKSQIIVVGEGITGRSAFTGHHQWISSGSFRGENHPPEVSSQLHHQFTAGMQTIAVIPVKSYGLVQLGSSLALMENTGFVNEVRSLILQLGLVPGALLSDNYHAVDPVPTSLLVPPNNMSRAYSCISSSDLIGDPISSGLADVQSVTGLSGGRGDYDDSGRDNSRLSNKVVPSQLSADGCAAFDVHGFLESTPLLEGIGTFNGMNQVSTSLSILDKGSSSFSGTDNTSFPDNLVHLEGVPLMSVNNHLPRKIGYRLGGGALKSEVENFPSKEHISGLGTESEQFDSGTNSTISTNLKYEEQSFGYALGDDLFDILGADYKEKILSCHSEKVFVNDLNSGGEKLVKDASNYGKTAETCPDYFPMRDGLSESCIFNGSGSNDLLDSIVSGSFSKQCSDDNVSCKTTLTKASISLVPGNSPPYAHFAPNSSQLRGGSFEFAKPVEISATSVSCSDISGHSLERNCSQSNNSVCGSQISSWVEQCHYMKHENGIVPSGYSKRPGSETVKSGRKRLKPGENPRPRPKDRQMIQDRLKELRELVPSGAKCSIDALLERTVKHMLFLQSVTKHADKLKQTRESKIRDKEGGLLLKDNLEGGATWAFEVGSQSMICPIIVEDLNPPRQMLVEMLCQERGLFLEIADAIRGMGLTILKGVMENRDDKIWAQFAVEANRDVTLMEIFMSLIHLIEKTGKSSPAPTTAVESNQMTHHSFSTGIPAGLQ